MKTPTILLAAGAALLLCGCDGYNATNCRQSALSSLPGCTEITNIPGHGFNFILRAPDGSIWYMEAMNFNDTKITAKTQLFGPRIGLEKPTPATAPTP